MLSVTAPSLPLVYSHVVFLVVLFSVRFYSSCTRSHSVLSFHLSLDHHLYADDTQLFLSFYPSNLDFSITHIQNALQAISSCMSANLLTLNTSKTEFLLVGLKQQLAKINCCSLDTVHSASNLGFIFHEHLTFLTRYLLFLNPATHIAYSSTSMHRSIS